MCIFFFLDWKILRKFILQKDYPKKVHIFGSNQYMMQVTKGEGTARPPLLAPADRTMHSRAQKYTNLLPSNSHNRPTWINIIQINLTKT